MKASKKHAVMMLTLFTGAVLLGGCDDIQKYTKRMNLTAEQTNKAKPIISEHLKRQNQILESIKNQRPAGGPGGPGRGSGRGEGRPDESQMEAMREKHKSELEEKFEENDGFAIRELEKVLTPEQIAEYKIIVKEIREKKMKENRPQGQGHGGGRGGPGGMGGAGRGMGGF